MNTIQFGRIWKLAAMAVWIAYGFGSLALAGLESIRLPPGFTIEMVSDTVPDARSMALGEDGTVYVGTRTEGNVYALPDRDQDGRPDRVVTIAKGLTMPNGVTVIDGALYVAEVPRLIRFDGIASELDHPPEAEVVFDRFPTDLDHGWKYLRLGPDGYLYMTIGAPCNICRPEKDVYASIVRMRPDGEDFEIYAHGVRNSLGFDWHPASRELYFTENGADRLGDDKPPEELNHAPKIGLDFGYPVCHAGTILDAEFGDQGNCRDSVAPVWKFAAHVAPLGARFYTGDQFPSEYKNQLFVAEHGSWNRSTPVGYRIEVVRFEGSTPVSSNVFAEGWLGADGQASGRPVDILELKDGSLLVSDDQRGAIYRISYRAKAIPASQNKASAGRN